MGFDVLFSTYRQPLTGVRPFMEILSSMRSAASTMMSAFARMLCGLVLRWSGTLTLTDQKVVSFVLLCLDALGALVVTGFLILARVLNAMLKLTLNASHHNLEFKVSPPKQGTAQHCARLSLSKWRLMSPRDQCQPDSLNLVGMRLGVL